MKRILLCSPFYKDKENTTCGIANWTRNIMSRMTSVEGFQVELMPYDRSVDLDEESRLWERLHSGFRDYLGVVFRTWKKIKISKYDLIQVSTSASLGLFRDYLLVKIACWYNTRIIFHFHFGRMPEILNGKNWESWLMRRVLKNCSASIVMDPKSFDSLKEHGYNSVYYLPNPLSNKILDYIESNLSASYRVKRQLLFVGHVVKTKGVFELVEACTQIENVSLRIVGKVFDDTKQSLLDIAQRRDGGTWLTFVGEISHKEVLREMSMCDMFVLPTYTEGFPNVILECMACGCPIIASDVGAIREMLNIDVKPCGVLIKPKSTDEVRNAIQSLIDDDKKKKELGDLARIRIQSQYNVEAIILQLKDVWHKVL